jgi:hypothetical protein
VIHVLVTARKKPIFEEYLGHWGRAVADVVRLHSYEDLPDRATVPHGTWLFSDLDELARPALELVTALRDAVAAAGMRIVNDPRRVLRRRELLQTLHARGLNGFRAYGLDQDLPELRYPVFIRRANAHTGPLTPLLHSSSEVEQWVARSWLWGVPADELLVVEFLDTADGAGQYRKYAAFIVGDEVIPRSLNRGDEWMVKHGTTDFSVAFQQEEVAYVEDNPHRAALREIADIACIEYGRIDYGISGARVQTWEINVCPTIGRGARPSRTPMPAEVRALRSRAKHRFYDAFARAWTALDDENAGPELALPWDHELRGAARRALQRPVTTDRLVLLRKVLQPVKPLLQPALDRVLMSLRPRH